MYTTPYTDFENLDRDLGLYAQDAWKVGRLTANLAARLDFMKNSVPAQELPSGTWVPARHFDAVDNVPNWKDFGPRIGANYDLFGNGRTALKTTLSRYVTTNGINYARTVNPIFTSVNSTTRPWTDVNTDSPAVDPRLHVPERRLRTWTARQQQLRRRQSGGRGV